MEDPPGHSSTPKRGSRDIQTYFRELEPLGAEALLRLKNLPSWKARQVHLRKRIDIFNDSWTEKSFKTRAHTHTHSGIPNLDEYSMTVPFTKGRETMEDPPGHSSTPKRGSRDIQT
ncbi:hypothetical protein CDAR_467751 [Caerostris darwini]|uniref:Uncharacterized protein n=1 Tax=Caerostris darwini TaxID=1538125 RepID=A0AAV4SMU6_9ARAC|nr:hypothetical protein CDAR_467751 [Caerostris darwini]